MHRPAEGSLDATEQDHLSEGREGRRACRKEEETNVSDCVAVQCKDWVEGVSWGKIKIKKEDWYHFTTKSLYHIHIYEPKRRRGI